MKVLWITNVPSPYRIDFFELLGNECELDVIFECPYSKERDSSWKNMRMKGFNSFFLTGIQYKPDMAFSLQIFRYIKKDYDIIVVTDYASLTGILAIAYMKQRKIPFILEGDGAYRGNGRGLKEKIKQRLISSARYWLATSKEHQKFYQYYGAKNERIYKYPFTSVHRKDILKMPPSPEDKLLLRKNKKICEDYVILSVGQFIHRKGFDLLLEAASQLGPDIGFYVVGGTPKAEYVSFVNKNHMENIHFLDFMNHEELREYYKLADLFVLPTREDIWGLVVNEALANALPVITTDACIAGCELIDNHCGRIIERENVNQLVSTINDLIYWEEWKREASTYCLEKISKYTLENMRDVHMKIFREILKGERNGNK